MTEYLILTLDGPLQAWGGHTFEDRRPSELIPTRSGLLGLLAACLGYRRTDVNKHQALASSLLFAVQIDNTPVKMIDYHTVKDARKEYKGLKKNDTIQTWREYLQDAKYSVAIWLTDYASISLDDLKTALNKPIFTPFLGRRSCPITQPLYKTHLEATDELSALKEASPDGGTIYSETEAIDKAKLQLRDVPIHGRKRQFAARTVTIHPSKGGENNVSH